MPSRTQLKPIPQKINILQAASEAVRNADLFELLNIYHQHPEKRKQIEEACQKGGKTAQTLYKKTKYYYFKYLEQQKSKTWEKYLSELPAVDDVTGDTALHRAIRKNDIVTAEKRITAKTDLNKQNKRGFSPWHLASALNREEILNLMLQSERKKHSFWYWLTAGIDLSAKDSNGQNVIHHCVLMKSEATLSSIFDVSHPKKSISALTMQDKFGRTPLHYAALSLNTKTLECLVKFIKRFKVECNIADNLGFTPLHYAASAGLLKNVELLLSLNIDTRKTATHSDPNTTPLSLAMTGAMQSANRDPKLESTYFEIIDRLLKDEDDFKIYDYFGHINALNLAAWRERSDLLKKWRTRTRFWFRDKQGRTPIHYAAMTGSLEMFKYLMSIGYTLRYKDKEGNTPLHIAALHNHTHIIEYAGEVYKKEQADYQQLWQIRQKMWEFQGLTDLDIMNNDGETPYMVAFSTGKSETIEALKRLGANPDSVYQYLFKAIYYPDAKKAKELGYPEFSKLEEKISAFAHRYADAITKYVDDKGNSFIHHCVLARQYRLLKILLHPLKQEDQVKLCQRPNHDGETPLDLIKKFKEEGVDNAAHLELLHKIERLLIRFYPEKFKKMGEIATIQYHFQWQQDVKEEIMRSYWYSRASYTARIAIPLYRAGVKYVATGGNVWLAGAEGVQAYVGADSIGVAETMLNASTNYLPDSMQTPVWYLQKGLWVYGMYNNTVMRASLEVLKQAVAYGVQHTPSQFESKNYLTHMNRFGLILAVSEELTRTYSGYISEQLNFQSFEESLHGYGVPRVRDVVSDALKSVNNMITDASGVNIRKSVYDAYLWARENIGQVPPPDQVFSEKYANRLIEEWQCKDEEIQYQLLLIANVLFEDSYDYGYAELTEKQMTVLSHYAQTGVFSEAACQVFSKAAVLMSDIGIDSSALLYQVMSSSSLTQSFNVSAEDKAAVHSQLESALKEVSFSNQENVFTALNEIASKTHHELIAKHIENETNKIQEGLKVDFLSSEFGKLVESLVQQNTSPNYDLLMQFNTLLNFVVLGDIPKEAETFVKLFENANADLSDLLSQFYMSSQGYALFNFDAALLEGHSQTLKEAIQNGLKEEKPILEIFKSINILFAEQFLKNTVSALSDSQTLSYSDEFKNALQTFALPMFSETGNDYAAKKDALVSLYGFLSNSGTVAQQSEFIAKICEQAAIAGQDVSQIVKMFYEASGFVNQFNPEKELMDQQVAELTNAISSLSNPDNKVNKSEILVAPFQALMENYINKSFTIEDPLIKNVVETAVVSGAKKELNDLAKLETYINGAWQIIHAGIVTNENVKVLEEISNNMAAQGHDASELIAHILLNSSGYKDVHFSDSVEQMHLTELKEAIKLSQEQGASLTSVFDGSLMKGDAAYLYPLSEKGVEAFNQAHQHNVLNLANDDAMCLVNSGFDSNTGKPNERNDIATYVAEGIIKHFCPGYPDITTPEIEAQKLLLIQEISTNQMKNYSKEWSTAKKNVNNFVVSQVTGQPQADFIYKYSFWEHIIKAPCNEILSKLIGVVPFPSYRPDLYGGSSMPGFSLNFGTNGNGFNSNFSFNGFTVPLFDSNGKNNSNFDFSLDQSRFPQGSGQSHHFSADNAADALRNFTFVDELSHPFGAPQSFFEEVFDENMDKFLDNMNPLLSGINKPDYYMPAFLAATHPVTNATAAPKQHTMPAVGANDSLLSLIQSANQSLPDKEFGNVAFLYPSQLNKPVKITLADKPKEKGVVEKAADLVLDAVLGGKAEAAVPLPKSTEIDDAPEYSAAEKALIGVGRAYVKAGEGLTQFGLELAEKANLVEEGTASEYTQKINQDKALYEQSEVGQSGVAQFAELATDIALTAAAPGGAGARGVKLVLSAATSGAVMRGLEANEEGTLKARALNAGKGALEGATGGLLYNKARKAVQAAYKKTRASRRIAEYSAKALESKKTKGSFTPGYNLRSKNASLIPDTASKNYSASFSPISREIQSFTVKSALDGVLYPKNKLFNLVNYLEKRGVYVYGTSGAPCFRGTSHGTCQIYLPENPTTLQVKHELSHWLDFKNIGYNKYARLSVYEREGMVLERLQSNRIWHDLNQLEKDFSIEYVEKIKMGYIPGVRYD